MASSMLSCSVSHTRGPQFATSMMNAISRPAVLQILPPNVVGHVDCKGSNCNRHVKRIRRTKQTIQASDSAEKIEMASESSVKTGSNQMEASFRFMAEGNMWLLEFAASGLRVLADPWLVDTLTFWQQPWLYTGRSESRQREAFPGDLTWDLVNSVDAIIISQEWEDHCHIPTLKLLRYDLGHALDNRKNIPVIASPKAATIVQRLGFTDVRGLAHGESTEIPGLQAWATVGGRVGPPWALRENGFVLQEAQTGLRIYYEPHCSFGEESVRSVSPVDVVITPGRQYKVAGLPLTESVDEAVRLLRILEPQVVLPIQLTHLEITGVTAPIVRIIGSVDEYARALREAGVKARIVTPPLSGHFVRVRVGERRRR